MKNKQTKKNPLYFGYFWFEFEERISELEENNLEHRNEKLPLRNYVEIWTFFWQRI